MSTALSLEMPNRHHAVFGTLPNVLADIYQDDVNMAVW